MVLLTIKSTAAITAAISEIDVADEWWRMVDTDLVMPMTPSPMMINVRRPMRSTRCVCLKLTTLHTHEMAITPSASTPTTTYLFQRLVTRFSSGCRDLPSYHAMYV